MEMKMEFEVAENAKKAWEVLGEGFGEVGDWVVR